MKDRRKGLMSTWITVSVVVIWLVCLELRLFIMRKNLRDHENSVGHEWARGIEKATKAHTYADWGGKL